MCAKKTLLEEAEEEICDLSKIERDFFIYHRDVNGLFFGKIENIPHANLPVIRAECLIWLLNKLVDKRFDSSSIINVRGVHIQGNATCDDLVFLKSLFLTGCYFSDKVVFFQCTFRNLIFRQLVFDKNITAEGICVKNNFFIKKSRFQRMLDIQGGHVGGSLGFIGSLFGSVESEIAIHANAIRVDGNVYLLSQVVDETKHKFSANGFVLFEGSIIKGFFECNEGLFNAPERLALSLAGSRIDGYVDLINCVAIGIVSLNSARTGASITIKGSKFFIIEP
ncbi:MAG: hypothetical protein D3922_11440, partial [Candidatus Electrothrix sp. AR1]|nr:hypothetical protein [Candidatus Electrothrix sp. AR1]